MLVITGLFMKRYTYLTLLLGLMIASILYIPNTYPQTTNPNELSVCTEESTKHWDKIIFKIINEEMAKKYNNHLIPNLI